MEEVFLCSFTWKGCKIKTYKVIQESVDFFRCYKEGNYFLDLRHINGMWQKLTDVMTQDAQEISKLIADKLKISADHNTSSAPTRNLR